MTQIRIKVLIIANIAHFKIKIKVLIIIKIYQIKTLIKNNKTQINIKNKILINKFIKIKKLIIN